MATTSCTLGLELITPAMQCPAEKKKEHLAAGLGAKASTMYKALVDLSDRGAHVDLRVCMGAIMT